MKRSPTPPSNRGNSPEQQDAPSSSSSAAIAAVKRASVIASTLPTVPRKPFPRALLIHPDPDRRQKIFIALTSRRFCVTAVGSVADALPLLKFPKSNNFFDCIFVDCDGDEQSSSSNNNSSGGGNPFGVSNSAASHLFAAGESRNNDPLIASLSQSAIGDAPMSPASSALLASQKSSSNNGGGLTSTQFLHVIRVKEHAAETALGRGLPVVAAEPTRTSASSSSSSRPSSTANKKKKLEASATETEKVRALRQGLGDLSHATGALSLFAQEEQEKVWQQQHDSDISNSNSLSERQRREQLQRRERASDIYHRSSIVAPPSQRDGNVTRSGGFFGQDKLSINSSLEEQEQSAAAAITSPVVVAPHRRKSLSLVEENREMGDSDDDDENDPDVDRDDPDPAHGRARVTSQHHHHKKKQQRQQESSSGKQKMNRLTVRGSTAQNLIFSSRSRHIVIGLCSSSSLREQLSDLTFCTTSLGLEFASVLNSKPAITRDNCISLYDSILRYPVKMHLDELEAAFVSPEDGIVSRFVSAPSLPELGALLTDVTERRLGGMLRVVHAPDWQKLTDAVSIGDTDTARAILQPIPRPCKMAKDPRGVSTVLTNQTVDMAGTADDIPAATAHALYRAQADVRRAQELLQLEKESLDATNLELEASHVRNRELVAALEKSEEEQCRLEAHVKFLSAQLERKQWECGELKRDAGKAMAQAGGANAAYERACEEHAAAALERERTKEMHEMEIAVIREAAASGKSVSLALKRHAAASSSMSVGNNSSKKEDDDGKPSTSPSTSPTRQRGRSPPRSTAATAAGKKTAAAAAPAPPAASSLSSRRPQSHHQQRSVSRGGRSAAGGAFKTFNAASFLQKQEARCIEVEIGLGAPLYLDLLADARCKCLDFMQENVRLREELFGAHSVIYDLQSKKTDSDAAVVAAAMAASISGGGGGGGLAATASRRAGGPGADLFASMRRIQQQQLHGGGGGTRTSIAASSSILSGGRKQSTANSTSTVPLTPMDQEQQQDAAAAAGGVGLSDAAEFAQLSGEAEKSQVARQLNRKWKRRLQSMSQRFEQRMMEALDVVSSVTVNENVLHLVKDGTRFRSANVDYEALRDSRCKSEFADDAVQGTLVDGGRGGGGSSSSVNNPQTALEAAAAASASSNGKGSAATAAKKTAVNITTGGTGGTAAAVINSLVSSAQGRCAEPVRACLQSSLEKLWSSMRMVSQGALMEVMTTHSAISHGLERLLAGYSLSREQLELEQKEQKLVQQMIALHQGYASAASPSSSSPAPTTISAALNQLVKLHQQHNPSGAAAANNSGGDKQQQQQQQPAPAPANKPPPFRRAQQAQLGQSLRRLFLERLTATYNNLQNSLSQHFCHHIVEIFRSAEKTMLDEVKKSVTPLALENAKLATALLVAKTAAHSAVSADPNATSKDKERVEDFFKTVSRRDGWQQTRPVIIRDPLVDDLIG